MNAHQIGFPTEHEMETALVAVEALQSLGFERRPTTICFRVPELEEGVEVTLPAEALRLLIRVLTHMAGGQAVAVMAVQSELSTQQAADLLGVSHSYLVRLLADGAVPFHLIGTHRRVRTADLVAYQHKRRGESRSILDALTREAPSPPPPPIAPEPPWATFVGSNPAHEESVRENFSVHVQATDNVGLVSLALQVGTESEPLEFVEPPQELPSGYLGSYPASVQGKLDLPISGC